MRIPTRPRSGSLKFDVTPLIDLVFNLIIFFLAASYFVRNEASIDVALPAAARTDRDENDSTRRIVVTVTGDHKLHVGAREVPPLELEQIILAGALEERDKKTGDFEVRIRGDKNVPYAHFEPILIACARAGVTNVKCAVIQKQP